MSGFQERENMKKMSILFVLASAFCGVLLAYHDEAEAQISDQATVAKSAESPKLVRMMFVRENGSFQDKFDTLKDVLQKSRGDKNNNSARQDIELISLDSRCDSSKPTSFAMHRLVNLGIGPTVESYFNFVDTLPKEKRYANPERKKRERAMIDEVQAMLSKTVFPRKAQCDATPILLSIGQYDSILLEVDDAGNALIGTKINDGMMHGAIADGDEFVEAFAEQANIPNFAARYGHNRYSNAQDAVNVARLSSSGNKVVIFDGIHSVVYRMGDFTVNNGLTGTAFDRQFDVFKTAKMRKDFKILAVVIGRDKVVKINEPPRGQGKIVVPT
jgi:hypothetical protein